MNILVLGNGFDLAHGLPTKYTDFLKFVEVIKQVEKLGETEDKIDWKDIDLNIKAMIIHKGLESTFTHIEEFIKLVDENLWIEYFLQNPLYQKENWIDFEKEISNVIKSIDDDMNNSSLEENIYELHNSFLNKRLLDDSAEVMINMLNVMNNRGSTMKHKPKITFKELIDLLDSDLNKMIRALEIYLEEYVGEISIKKKSPDIKELSIHSVLNFNYTDTYERIYGLNKYIEYDYIHGKADIQKTVESNNMVLGIDEYLDEERKDKDVEFITFKKFYQRIHKETGCKYKKCTDEMKENWLRLKEVLKANIRKDISEQRFVDLQTYINRVYIFGHSLDVTDKDILRDLILNDNVHTTIYYVNKKVYGQQIANLVKVIGQDELIKRTGGSTKTITFKLQADMVNIEEN
jgi:hypothetical protein